MAGVAIIVRILSVKAQYFIIIHTGLYPRGGGGRGPKGQWEVQARSCR